MQSTVWYAIGILLVVFVEYVFCQSFVGDDCTMKKTGEPGICELFRKCSEALHDFRIKRVYPQNCGFEGNHPIVCCRMNASDEDSNSTQTTSTESVMMTTTTSMPITTTESITNIGEKSRQKCEEYGMLGGQNVSVHSCFYESAGLIIEGNHAIPKEFPHMAAIGFDGDDGKVWECGGSLISANYVLTAAHCLYHYIYGEPRYVRLGDLILNSNDDDASPQEFTIIEKITHPDYKPPLQYNDIALIKLDREVTFNAYIKPACLFTNQTLTTKLGLASSWGKMNRTASNYKGILVHRLDYITNMQCNQIYGNYGGKGLKDGIIDEIQICANSVAKNQCQTDTGGPLQIYHETSCLYNLVGITSFAKPCGIISFPGIYTRISKYIQWIEEIVWP